MPVCGDHESISVACWVLLIRLHCLTIWLQSWDLLYFNCSACGLAHHTLQGQSCCCVTSSHNHGGLNFLVMEFGHLLLLVLTKHSTPLYYLHIPDWRAASNHLQHQGLQIKSEQLQTADLSRSHSKYIGDTRDYHQHARKGFKITVVLFNLEKISKKNPIKLSQSTKVNILTLCLSLSLFVII